MVKIVPFDPKYLIPVVELIDSDLSEPYSVYTYRFFLHQWPHLSFLALDGDTDTVVGTVVSKLERHKRGAMRGYIGMLVVDPKMRKCGLGSQLVQATLGALKEHGCEEVVLETEVDNVSAIRLYLRFGFFMDKKLPRYYMNSNDAIRLKLIMSG